MFLSKSFVDAGGLRSISQHLPSSLNVAALLENWNFKIYYLRFRCSGTGTAGRLTPVVQVNSWPAGCSATRTSLSMLDGAIARGDSMTGVSATDG